MPESPEYDRVLVPTDGSERVDRTLEHAVRLARDHGATVHALSVVDRRLTHAAGDAREAMIERLHDRADGAVADVAERAEEAGLPVETVVREGVPDKEIVAYADEEDADVVVIGTHGLTGRDRLANLGSVTERVVQNADRPVFVVPIGD